MMLVRITLKTICRRFPWVLLALMPLACGGRPGEQPLAPTAPSSITPLTPPSSSVSSGGAVLSTQDEDDEDDNEPRAKAELEGEIQSIDRAQRRFVVRDRTVRVTDDTEIRHGSRSRSFDDLNAGDRVHVKGTADGDLVVADRIELQNEDERHEVELEGTVSDLAGACPALRFQFDSRHIVTDRDTSFARGRCEDLKNGQRVEVRGIPESDGVVRARHVKLPEHGNDDDDDDDDAAPGEREIEVKGEIGGLDGRCPTLSFLVRGERVATDSQTRFESASCSELRNGQRVEVEGVRRPDGPIRARKVSRQRDTPAPTPPPVPSEEVEIDGAIGDLGGSCPTLSFKIRGQQIVTNGSTRFERASCGNLRNGDRVEVEGTGQTGGAVLAKKVKGAR